MREDLCELAGHARPLPEDTPPGRFWFNNWDYCHREVYPGRTHDQVKELVMADARHRVNNSSDDNQDLYKDILTNAHHFQKLGDLVFGKSETRKMGNGKAHEPLINVKSLEQVIKEVAPETERDIMELGLFAADLFRPLAGRIESFAATSDAAAELIASSGDADDATSSDDVAVTSANAPSSVSIPVPPVNAPASSASIPVLSGSITALPTPNK